MITFIMKMLMKIKNQKNYLYLMKSHSKRIFIV